MAIDPERLARFEDLGLDNVKDLRWQWSGDLRNDAMAWVAQLEREERSRNEVSQALQMRVALSAKRAAWIAAIAAIIAVIAAIVTVIVEIMK
jgi:hypothetical protein